MVNDTIVVISNVKLHSDNLGIDTLLHTSINSLTKRVDNIENMDYKAIIPIVISIIIPLISWLVMRHSYNKDKERSILSNLIIDYRDVENRLILQYGKIETNKNDFNYHVENMLNVIENMCYEYNLGNLDSKNFNHKFRDKIIAYYETFQEYYGKLSKYQDTINYIKKQ